MDGLLGYVRSVEAQVTETVYIVGNRMMVSKSTGPYTTGNCLMRQ